ncbi:hypothetical protein SARC_17931, partial [Sphaeroforma arctica JP610]
MEALTLATEACGHGEKLRLRDTNGQGVRLRALKRVHTNAMASINSAVLRLRSAATDQRQFAFQLEYLAVMM